jgi:hypothetical protein
VCRQALSGDGGGEPFPVGPLSPPQAYQLLATNVSAGLVADEAEPLRELARLCGHLPLALRIAAANVAGRPRGAVASLVAALRDGDRVGSLEVPGDERVGLRATFDRSYLAVPVPARRLFRLLALAAGPEVSVPAAAALGGLPVAAAAALLAQLAVVGLIRERTAGRYRLPELFALFAAKLRADDDTAAPVRPAVGLSGRTAGDVRSVA